MRPVRPLALALLTVALVVLGAVPALADPALPSNYVSQLVDVPDVPSIAVRIEGGDAYFVLEVQPGTEVIVPGYDDDTDVSDIEELEQYLRVRADGTVQLNRNSQAYYTNAARFGAAAPPGVGPDATPDWETVADDGRVAWHDHRIHFMSPTPPAQVATDADEPQRVFEYAVPLLVDGEVVVVEGTLDYVAERSVVPVALVALLGLVGAALVARRDQRPAALLALVAGGVVTGLLVAATTGRVTGFEIATPPIALVAVGALAPLLGAFVPNLKEGQDRLLVLLGGAALLLFGLLAAGLADGFIGGPGGGLGNWWTNPTLPADVAPEVLRFALALATGVGAGILVGVLGGSNTEADLAELGLE